MNRIVLALVIVVSIAALIAGCGGGGGGTSDPGGNDGITLSGRAVEVGTTRGLVGVTVSCGSSTATTAADGSFRLTNMNLGSKTVYAQLSGYEMSYAKVNLTGTSTTLSSSIKMAPTTGSPTGSHYIFRGTVRDDDTGAAVVGAVVKIGTVQTDTTTNGRFWMELPSTPTVTTYTVDGRYATPSTVGYFDFWARMSDNSVKNAKCLRIPTSPSTGVDVGTIKLKSADNVPPFPPACQ